MLSLIVTPPPLCPAHARGEGDCLILVLFLSKGSLLNSQQKELCGKVAACGVHGKRFVKFIFSNNKLGCLKPTLPLRTTKILDKYYNVLFKSLRATKEGTNDKLKSQERRKSQEKLTWPLGLHFYSGQFSIQNVVAERLETEQRF